MNKRTSPTWVRPLTVLAAVATLTAACGGDAGSSGDSGGGPGEVTLGLVVEKTFEAGVVPKITKEVGCFEDENVDVEIVAFQGGADLVKGMLSGAADIGAATGFDPPAAAAKGIPMKAFYGVAELSPFVVIAGPDSGIEQADDLVGKKVGITRFGSATDFVVRVLASQAGSPDGITAVPLGDAAAQTAALQRGDIDAFVWSTEVGLALEASGDGRIISRFAEVFDEDQYGVLMAQDEYLEQNNETVQAVADAYRCGIEWMQDDANREDAIAMTAEFLEIDPEVAEATFEELVGHLSPDGAMNTAGLESLASFLPELGIADEVPELDTYHTDEFVN